MAEPNGVSTVATPAQPLRVESVGKLYRLYERPQDRLLHGLLHRFGRSWGQDFWALRGVSFDLARGAALGVIGRNGSGKSTLLQLLAGTLAPSEGRILLDGTVAGLLELGSGFNPEFTGRENALLNGAILGIPEAEMSRRLPAVAAFAEIGDFFERPVKLYSSGMFLRLAFAVATSVEAPILLIDEALAVGDVFFQQKCYTRLARLRENGTAVVLVSHAMPDVEQFCDEAMLLEAGSVVFQGPAREAVREYYLLEQRIRGVLVPGASGADPGAPVADPTGEAPAVVAAPISAPPVAAQLDLAGVAQVGEGRARCTMVAVCDAHEQPCLSFEQGERAVIHYEFELLDDVEVPVGGINLANIRSVLVHGRNALQFDSELPRQLRAGSRVGFRQELALSLAAGEYTLEVGLATLPATVFDLRNTLSDREIEAALVRLCHLPAVGKLAVRLGPSGRTWHHGVAWLDGACSVRVTRAESAQEEG